MTDRLAADATLLLHLAFIAFVLLGGLLALRWRWIPWLHLPAVAWGVYVELSGSICPLTLVENHFRLRAAQGAYAGGFVERYLLPVIYPDGLTADVQLVLAAVVVVVNLAAYALVLRRRRRSRDQSDRDRNRAPGIGL